MTKFSDRSGQKAKDQGPADRASVVAAAVLDVIEWLAGNDCQDLDDAGLIAGLGRRLRAVGLPIDRMSLHLRTLHPEILGRTVAWAPNEPVEIRDREHGILTTAAFIRSPLRQVMETREAVTVRADDPSGPPWIHIDIFEKRNLAEAIIVPLCNADGPVSAAAFCTTRLQGFSAQDRRVLDRILPALRNVCELRTLRQVELTLLDTYIGTTTARRILAGRIRRGEVESFDAALMLCDLRGFTEMSNRLPSSRVLELLDTYFDLVVPAITAAGGEVLKFMGDAVLAFFHHETPEAACAAALQGARNALARLAEFTAEDAELHAGIALHYGEASYGNIGSGQRLDFTLIGPDVNLVSRIQGVCSTTGHPLIMSERFADLLAASGVEASGDANRTAPIGRHPLRGFDEPVSLHVLENGAARGTENGQVVSAVQ